jgi:transposase
MKRYSKEEKLDAIRAVEAGDSILSVAKRYGISKSVLHWSLQNYQEHGEEGVSSKGQSWSQDQKIETVKYMLENHLSYSRIGILFGVSDKTIKEWEHRYLEKGIEGLKNKKKSRKPRVQKPKPPKTRLEELEEENLNLRIENEYLKKLNALVAEREKRERANR